MVKTFLLITMNTRIKDAKELILSKAILPDAEEWRFVVVATMYSDEEKAEMSEWLAKNSPESKIIYLDKMIGPHSSRMAAHKAFYSDIWVNLDDDMLFTSKTDYRPIVERLVSDKSVGFISGNWAKTEKQALSKKTKDEFLKQNIVYTGGGLCYRSNVADFMRDEVPDRPYLFDDVEWALQAYIRGYTNYRYLGSVTVHRVCTVGGRRNWVRLGSKYPPDETMFNLRKSKPFYNNPDNDYCICMSSDLTEKAHQLHKKNKKGE